MASPQCEDGYTRISNELLDALIRFALSKSDRKIFDYIMRKTYGFRKKSDSISLSQFSIATGLTVRNVCRSIDSLVKMKFIGTVKNDSGKANKYWINKDYSSWIGTVDFDRSVNFDTVNSGKQVLSFLTDTKEINTKEKTNTLVPKIEQTNGDKFEEFWKAYPPRGNPPARMNKTNAKKVWNSLSKKKELPELDEIVCALERYKISDQWERPEYIPHCSTWLNRKPWTDEIAPTKKSTDSVYRRMS